jgi:RimJ/RimL family protein N-acetyltransferase
MGLNGIKLVSGGQTGADRAALDFAVAAKEDSQLTGTVGLREIDAEHSQAEMGFWIGVPSWGEGYATEAAWRVVRYVFEELKLNRVYAHHVVRNPASGRGLEKLGMKREGLLRQRVRKWGVFEDVVLLAILHDDWRQMNEKRSGGRLARLAGARRHAALRRAGGRRVVRSHRRVSRE